MTDLGQNFGKNETWKIFNGFMTLLPYKGSLGPTLQNVGEF